MNYQASCGAYVARLDMATREIVVTAFATDFVVARGEWIGGKMYLDATPKVPIALSVLVALSTELHNSIEEGASW